MAGIGFVTHGAKFCIGKQYPRLWIGIALAWQTAKVASEQLLPFHHICGTNHHYAFTGFVDFQGYRCRFSGILASNIKNCSDEYTVLLLPARARGNRRGADWRPNLQKQSAKEERALMKKAPLPAIATGALSLLCRGDYIMPPMPPMPPAGMPGAGFSSLMSAMTHSVVRNMPAMLAAFSRATRVTLAGSITPAANRFS